MKKVVSLLLAVVLLAGVLPVMAAAEETSSTWLSDELVEIHVMREENASQVIQSDSVKIQYIEKLLNIKLVVEAVPAASYADKKQVLIATDNMPDLIKVTADDVRTYARDGMFVCLSDYRDQLPNFFAAYESKESNMMLNVDGKCYAAPTLRRPSENDSRFLIGGQLPVIRIDLLEKYGLEVPTTFDELYDVLMVFKENNPDCIPLTNRKGGSTTATQKLLDTMAYSLGSGSTMYYDEDLGGVWVYGPANENFKEVLRYLNKLYEAGLLDPDYATNTVDLWKEKMSSGKALMYFDNNGFASQFNIALQTIDPSYELQVIPTMTNSLGQTRNFMYSMDWTDQLWAIPASTENLDVCLKFLDWCYSDEGADVNGYGEPGVTFEYVDGKPRILESVLEKYAASGSSTAYYDIQSDLGVGLLDLAPYVDIGCQVQMQNYLMTAEELEKYEYVSALLEADEGLRQPVSVNPPLTAEQTERYNELKTAVVNICSQEWDKYIMGVEPIDNYDNVIAAAREAGATEMEQIYNDAWNAALGK